jgi:WD40 repeat protein
MENQKHESLDNIDNSSFASSPFSSPKRRGIFNRLSSTGSNESSQLKRLGRRKRDLFVTASRDNTLRIWELDNNNGHDEHFEGSGEIDYDDDEINSSDRKKDPLRKGKKLRGHAFGVSGGVLCVCAVPSLPSSAASMCDESNESIGEEDGMISVGQFVSGGADGVLRVYDVRSAVNLDKVPKSGMYQTIQLQKLNPFSVHDGDSTAEDESTIGASVRSGESSRGAAVAVTSVKCSPKQSERVGLFASYADGVIRCYSPLNGSSIGHGVSRAIHWSLTCVFEGHGHPITSLSLLSSQSLPQQEAVTDNDQPGTILISSSADGCIRVWDGAQGECSEKSEEPIRISAALWEIELNDDDAGGENDCDNKCDRPPTSINVRTLVERVGVVSLTCFSEGLMMAAGTTDGAIRLWDVSSGLYEGAYNLGKSVQVWSLSVLSERDIYEGYDEFGELKIYSAGILIAGDNRGRIRILHKTYSRVSSEIDQDDEEASRIFGSD